MCSLDECLWLECNRFVDLHCLELIRRVLTTNPLEDLLPTEEVIELVKLTSVTERRRYLPQANQYQYFQAGKICQGEMNIKALLAASGG